MDDGLSITTWVTIDDSCKITYDVIGSGQADFTFRDDQRFGIAIDPEALRAFLNAGTKALGEMDRLYAEEQAES